LPAPVALPNTVLAERAIRFIASPDDSRASGGSRALE
jgi:hypothetical protein